MSVSVGAVQSVLEELGLTGVASGAAHGEWLPTGGAEIASVTPVDGSELGRVRLATVEDYERVIARMGASFEQWRMLPAPRRGEIVRQLGEEFRRHKAALGALISWEMGKIRSEGEGEVQEVIDIADFAVGLSRQLYGLTMHSERPGHRMYEQ
ncbi:MAG: aldehyde dehydrogenase family protein, partial [Gemmatimonadetes bacterium]|nr:aldehyde dehydrogenase family protein [Gemmatimonadota bacterium]